MSKTLRIIVVPGTSAASDRRLAGGLAAGFRDIGQEAQSLEAPLGARALMEYLQGLSANVVVQINNKRDPDYPLPAGVRSISWYQDVFPSTLDGFSEGFLPEDILYAFGDPVILGLNAKLPCPVLSLCPGVATDLRSPCVDEPSIDFSLCAYMPPPRSAPTDLSARVLRLGDSILRRLPAMKGDDSIWLLYRYIFRNDIPAMYIPYRVANMMAEVVAANYRPLTGDLNIHCLEAALTRLIERERATGSIPERAFLMPRGPEPLPAVLKFYSLIGGRKAEAPLATYRAERQLTSQIGRAVNQFVREYPRLLDREMIVRNALRVSSSLELYGPGWQLHTSFRPYAKGTISDLDCLLALYRRSRLNLANNTHGIGLHSRNLECMAVGGFLFTHESPHDRRPGGMLTCFEPGVHFGSFRPETFEEQAERWLKDPASRRLAGERAAARVREQHGWHHRARQIVDDLTR